MPLTADFSIKVGDRMPPMTGTLLDAGEPLDLSPANTTVRWTMRDLSTGDTVDAPADVTDPAGGEVAYYWTPADTASPTTYLGEWVVTYPDGREQTFPAESPLVIAVVPDVLTEGISADPIDPSTLAVLRSWVGSTPSDAELAVLYAGAGAQSMAATALLVLRSRRADLLTSPLSFTIPGDLTVNASANLTALDAAIATLEAMTPTTELPDGSTPGTLAGARLVRADNQWGRVPLSLSRRTAASTGLFGDL